LTPSRFASAASFLNTATDLRKSLRSKMKVPQFFFKRMYLQSNGFCGYDVSLDRNEEVEV
jgi:hypothetical protein